MAANSHTNSGSLYRNSVTTANDDISLSFWAYFNSLSSDQYQVFQNGTTGGFGEGWGLYVSASDSKFHIDVAFVVDITFNTVLSTGTWYQCILIRDSGTWKMYINGTQEGNTATDDPFGIGGSDKTVLFGYWSDGSTLANDATDMRLSKVGFWDRVLTGTEISNLASCSTTPDDYSTNLLVSLPLDNSGTFGTNGGSAGNFTTNGSLALADDPAQCSAAPTVHHLNLLGIGS